MGNGETNEDAQLPEFNLFNVLEVWQQERAQSEFLAWLMDPASSHGLGNAFLRVFIRHVVAEAHVLYEDGTLVSQPPAEETVAGWLLSDAEVETEWRFIDIIGADGTDKVVWFVENKVFSGEHSNQLSRYLEIVESEYAGFTILPVFLTIRALYPQSPDNKQKYIPIGYDEIADLVERTREDNPGMDTGIAFFLSQYTRALRKYMLQEEDGNRRT
ncbi:MAG: PD-(D/E)XK nuclease family protein [Chloroflexi bacterium]|nr:PD-(D/E)XK nuclease family protein [Chloroflexota bacterium]